MWQQGVRPAHRRGVVRRKVSSTLTLPTECLKSSYTLSTVRVLTLREGGGKLTACTAKCLERQRSDCMHLEPFRTYGIHECAVIPCPILSQHTSLHTVTHCLHNPKT